MKTWPDDWTTAAANVATVVTALFAFLIWLRFKSDLKAKTDRLVNYLKEKGREARAKDSTKKGAFGAVIIARDTGLTEAEIFQISVNSPERIGRLARMHENTDYAKEVIFYYKEEGEANP